MAKQKRSASAPSAARKPSAPPKPAPQSAKPSGPSTTPAGATTSGGGSFASAVRRAGKALDAREAKQISTQYGVPLNRVAQRARQRGANVRYGVYRDIAANRDQGNATPPEQSSNASNQGFDWQSYLDESAQRQNDSFAELSEGFTSALEGILGQFGETLAGLKNDESADRARQAEEQKKRDEEARQSAIDEQLQGLRSGSTVGGTPGSGMEGAGSLASGRSSYQRSFSSALDNYRRSLDPTDSVLDRESGVEDMRRERRRDRGEGGRRALTGSGGGDYYARRFG